MAARSAHAPQQNCIRIELIDLLFMFTKKWSEWSLLFEQRDN